MHGVENWRPKPKAVAKLLELPEMTPGADVTDAGFRLNPVARLRLLAITPTIHSTDTDRRNKMAFSEAEMQLLGVLYEAEIENGPTDRAALEKDGDERFWLYKEDWSPALPGS